MRSSEVAEIGFIAPIACKSSSVVRKESPSLLVKPPGRDVLDVAVGVAFFGCSVFVVSLSGTVLVCCCVGGEVGGGGGCRYCFG